MAMAGKNDQGKKLGLVLALAGAVGAAAYLGYRKYVTKKVLDKAATPQPPVTECSQPQTERVEEVISTDSQRKRIETTPPPRGDSKERTASTNSGNSTPPATDTATGNMTPLATDEHHFGNGENVSGNNNGTLETKEENDVIVVDKRAPLGMIAESKFEVDPSGSGLSETGVSSDAAMISKEEVQPLHAVCASSEHPTDSEEPQSFLTSISSPEGPTADISFDGSIITKDQIVEMQCATTVDTEHVANLPDEEGQSPTQAQPAIESTTLTSTGQAPEFLLTDTSFDGSIITQEQIQDIPSDPVEQQACSQQSETPETDVSWMSRFDGSVINPADDQEEDTPQEEQEQPANTTAANNSGSDNHSTSENSSESSGSDDDNEKSGGVWLLKPDSEEDMVDFGIRIKTEDGEDKFQHSVEEVEEGSPAEQIGLRKGDEIMRLNGMYVYQWRHDVLMEQFRLVPADNLDMTLRRQDENNVIYKDVKARLRNTDEVVPEDDFTDLSNAASGLLRNRMKGIAVSSEELDVSEAQLESDRDIIIAAYNGQDRKRTCRIKRAGSEQYIRAIGHKLDVAELSDESEQNFIFRREMFNCIDKCPDSPYFEKRIYVFVFRAGKKGAQQGFLTALNRGSVGLQRKDRLRGHPHSLSRADARFFIHHFAASGFDCFESTQLPGHYLACNHGRVYLKWVPVEKDRDLTNEVHFIVKYL